MLIDIGQSVSLFGITDKAKKNEGYIDNDTGIRKPALKGSSQTALRQTTQQILQPEL
jgi:hypothetical protein